MSPTPGLTARGRRVLLAAAEALAGAPAGEEVARAADELVGRLPAADRRQLRLLLEAVRLAPLTHGRLATFPALSPADREAVLRGWAESAVPVLRQGATALRALALLAYYGREEEGAELGYDGPWLGRVPVAVLPAPSLSPAGVAGRPMPAGRGRGGAEVSPGRPGPARAGLAAGVHAAGRYPADLQVRAEVCVIGTGAGGAAALARLAGARDVVAVEAGSHARARDFTQRELEMLALLYQEAGLRATADKAIGILQGRGVGGSTLHNTGLVYPTPRGIAERWRREHGLPLDEADLERRTAAVLETLAAVPIPEARINANNAVLRRGAEALGWRCRVPLHNRVECCGCGYCMLGCAYNRKSNASLTYLPRAVAAGARVLADARAVRIEGRAGARRVVCERLDGAGRVVGRAVVEAPVVVVAAGALDTPALLRRSRLGNGRVGRGLRLHPAALVHAVFAEPIEAWRGLPQSVLVEEFASFLDDGYGGFVFIPSAGNWPGLTAVAAAGMGETHRRLMRQLPRIAAAAVLLHDETEGRVRAAGDGRPLAEYWPGRPDLAELRRGIEALARLYLAAGAERVHLPFAAAAPVASEAELRAELSRLVAAPHRLTLNSVHPQGSCALGVDPHRSATDPYGEVRGAPGVFIADASLFPTSVGVPPQVSIMMLAGAVADRVLESGS